jgi:hypothetical protein
MTATGNKPILSQESGASISPFTRDSQEEIERIRNEEKQSAPNEPFNM